MAFYLANRTLNISETLSYTMSDQLIEKGTLLLAEPFLADQTFARTVILICEHNETGTVGFILNNKTEYHLPDVLEDLSDADQDLYIGGPVQQNTLHYLHRVGPIIQNAYQVNAHIYWGGNFDQLKVNTTFQTIDPQDIRFFLGYTGWGPGQLQQEIDDKTWMAFSGLDFDFFDTPPNELWRAILKEMGGKYREMANYPKDPNLN
jgi:putative transcriptional regulator